MSTEKLSEEEHEHIYSCLLVGNAEFAKIKKSNAKLNREDPRIDGDIELNAKLRRRFNPNAEAEAREAARRKDPTQLDITDREAMASSGETGGGHKAGQIVKLRIEGNEVDPTEEAVRDNLLELDRCIMLQDVRGWTSTELDAVVRFMNGEMMLGRDLPENPAPEFLDIISLSQERVDRLIDVGPHRPVVVNQDDIDSPMRIDRFYDGGSEEGGVEYADAVEADIAAARQNRALLKADGMEREIALRWNTAGPWGVVGEPQGDGTTRWFVVQENQKERAENEDDAILTAGRYNRSVAGRDDDGAWREPPPAHVPDEAVETIKVAAADGK